MFNPMVILSTRFVAPLILRFAGFAVSNIAIRSVIGSVAPLLLRLPFRTLLQIAFWRSIYVSGRQITNPSAIGAVTSALSLLPGVTPGFIGSHRGAFDLLLRIITWFWLLYSQATLWTTISFMIPFTVTALSFFSANVAWVSPIFSYIISVLKSLIPSFSWELFYSVRAFIVSVLMHGSDIASSPVVKSTMTWSVSILALSEFCYHWVSPFMSIDQWVGIAQAIGNLMEPIIPDVLVNVASILGTALFATASFPIAAFSVILPYLHHYIAMIPYSTSIWTFAQMVGGYTLHIFL